MFHFLVPRPQCDAHPMLRLRDGLLLSGWRSRMSRLNACSLTCVGGGLAVNASLYCLYVYAAYCVFAPLQSKSD